MISLFRKRKSIVILLSVVLLVLAQCAGQQKTNSPKIGLPPIQIKSGDVLSRTLHTEGTKILNDQGEEIRLIGVNVCSLEWTARGENVLDSVYMAFANWNCNIVRLPMSQDRWFGKAPEMFDEGDGYKFIVEEVVRLAASFGKYVELDLHWSNAGEWGKYIGQHCMPDENSLEFWIDVAKTYANHPAVLFNIYNEPYRITWDVWRDGGTITETVNAGKPNQDTVTYFSPGHQKFVDEIRKAGANNLILVGGLGYAFDLKGIFKDNSPECYALKDTPEGNGIAYETHIYPDKMDYVRSVLPLVAEQPVVVGEIGIGLDGAYGAKARPNWLSGMLDWIDENNLHWIGWSFHPAATPCLIEDWKYTPTPHFGEMAKERLLSYPDTNAHLRKPR